VVGVGSKGSDWNLGKLPAGTSPGHFPGRPGTCGTRRTVVSAPAEKGNGGDIRGNENNQECSLSFVPPQKRLIQVKEAGNVLRRLGADVGLSLFSGSSLSLPSFSSYIIINLTAALSTESSCQ
jgi:hypothetical protein